MRTVSKTVNPGSNPGSPACLGDGTSDDCERDDLAELLARGALTDDAARPEAVERRHEAGGRTARENIADLVDPGSFVEYGRFAIAAQRGRRERRGADRAHAGRRPRRRAPRGSTASCSASARACAVLSYDYTVLAGTQGALGHRKKDRLFELIERMRLPTVFFAEGGGGRPGDTDYPGRLGARHAGVRALGAALGRRAADRRRRRPLLRRQRGDRRLLGPDRRDRERLARDGRPGDDRGRRARRASTPTRSARSRCRRRNGVVDVAVADEAEATAVDEAAARLLPGRGAAGRGARPGARCASSCPSAQRRAYAVAPIVETLADEGSVTFLRERFAPEMVHRARPDRGPPARRHRQRHAAHGRRDHQRRRPTRRRASCSSATPSACRSSRSSTRRG